MQASTHIQSRTARHMANVASAVYGHRVLIGVVASYVAALFLISGALGIETELQWGAHSEVMFVALGVAAMVFGFSYFARLMLVDRPAQLGPHVMGNLKSFALDSKTITSIAIPLLLLPFFSSTFTSFKSMIPAINAYRFDELFAAWDAWLHFGFHPIELAHGLFGIKAAAVFDFFYTLWFPFMWAFVLIHVVETKRPAERTQFLVSYVLVWIVLGTVLAITLASTGPVYYGRITGLDDPFSPFMDVLRAADNALLENGGWWPRVWAVSLQDWLWQQYETGSLSPGSGISAMPSLHIGVATLNALAAWRTHRVFGWIMIGFAASIQLGAVYLGWHYAIDGYLSIILTIAIWKVVGHFAFQGEAAPR